MIPRETGRRIWHRWRYSLIVGAGVGLLTGVIGVLFSELLLSTYAGGFVGAVGCGISVAFLSEERLVTVIVQKCGHHVVPQRLDG